MKQNRDFTFAIGGSLSGVAPVGCMVIIRGQRTGRRSMMVKGGAVIGRRAQVAVGSSEELRWKGDSGYKEWGSYIIERFYKSLKQQ
jgi:hypothetical protein